MRLFDVPEAAVPAAAEPPFPLGGIGGGHFVWDDEGRFRDWRLASAEPNRTSALHDRFRVWWRADRKSSALPLAGNALGSTRRLFPVTWREYRFSSPEALRTRPRIESASFSPLLPTEGFERSLPIHIVAFRVHNPSDVDMEVALMLTWACGWPELMPDAQFDMQHDNLCLTGSLGSPASPNRQGIAVPDLHYAGIYQQGIEPWVVPDEENELLEDFAEDGELDPRVVRSVPHGAAAWLKFALEPGETKEAPFVLAWHFPVYEHGPAAGLARYYTQFLGRRRPDNAIVWLAEQAVQHYGAETANYRYWYQQIRDWQDGNGLGSELNGLAELLRADVTWTEERGLEPASTSASARFTSALQEALGIWPDVCARR